MLTHLPCLEAAEGSAQRTAPTGVATPIQTALHHLVSQHAFRKVMQVATQGASLEKEDQACFKSSVNSTSSMARHARGRACTGGTKLCVAAAADVAPPDPAHGLRGGSQRKQARSFRRALASQGTKASLRATLREARRRLHVPQGSAASHCSHCACGPEGTWSPPLGEALGEVRRLRS